MFHALKKGLLVPKTGLFFISNKFVTVEDLLMMLPPEQLTDTAIDICLHTLVTKYSNADVIGASVFPLFLSIARNSNNITQLQAIVEFNLTMKFIMIPWCESSHWRLIVIFPIERLFSIMNPLGESTAEIRRIKNCLITGFLSKITDCSWKYKEIPHETQTDSHSCGVHVIRFAYDLCNDPSFNSFTVDYTRFALIKNLMNVGIVSEIYCCLCRHKSSASSGDVDDWIQCDNCDRWYHMSCLHYNPIKISSASFSHFKCNICLACDTIENQKSHDMKKYHDAKKN